MQQVFFTQNSRKMHTQTHMDKTHSRANRRTHTRPYNARIIRVCCCIALVQNQPESVRERTCLSVCVCVFGGSVGRAYNNNNLRAARVLQTYTHKSRDSSQSAMGSKTLTNVHAAHMCLSVDNGWFARQQQQPQYTREYTAVEV